MATYRVQKSRSTLPSRVQPILTSALTHYQNNFRKLNFNQMRFDEISEHARLVRHAHHVRTTCLFDAWLSWTWKCSLQRKFSAGFANKLQNQFCGRGRSQALLRLRCVLCWFIRLKNINIDRCWFLCLNYSKFFLHNEKVIGLVK